MLVASLKASFVFLADLARALPIVHRVDFVELAGYGGRETGGERGVRLLKDLDADILDRDVLLVEDVVDTGLTLNYLVKSFSLRSPRSLAVATLLDRRTAASSTTYRCATSASRRPTSSSSATASISTSATGIFRTCTSPISRDNRGGRRGNR